MKKTKKKIKIDTNKKKGNKKESKKETTAETSVKQRKNRTYAASILNWVAIMVLVFFAIVMVVSYFSWESYVSELDAQTLAEISEMEVSLGELKTAILYLVGISFVSAILIFLLKTGIEKKKIGWGWLLGLSIFFTLAGLFLLFTLVPGILGIIASILYATDKK